MLVRGSLDKAGLLIAYVLREETKPLSILTLAVHLTKKEGVGGATGGRVQGCTGWAGLSLGKHWQVSSRPGCVCLGEQRSGLPS